MKNIKATIALVTVTYNSGQVIHDFMTSVLQQDYPDFKLYIVDNDSADETLAIIAGYSDPRMVLLPQSENSGFAAGTNLGIKRAIQDGGDYLLLINNDTVFGQDFLTRLMAGLELNQAAMVAPKMLYFSPANKIWWAGGYFDSRLSLKNIHVGEDQIDTGQYDNGGVVSFAPMCCVLIKAQLFDLVGLLDEKFFAYYEDADWMYRAQKLQQKLFYLPNVILYHKVSSLTGGKKSPFTVRLCTRNKVYFIRKHYSGLSKYFHLCKYFIGISVGHWLGRYSWAEVKMKIPAFFSGLRL